jgi:hypothetical protein
MLPVCQTNNMPYSTPITPPPSEVRKRIAQVCDTSGLDVGALRIALRQISVADARAFFEHCGYRFPPNLGQWFCT